VPVAIGIASPAYSAIALPASGLPPVVSAAVRVVVPPGALLVGVGRREKV